jgi:hypothetical protein
MSLKKTIEVFWALGHPNIQASHSTTLMFTKDVHVSKTGDCVIAIASDKSAADLSTQFKNGLRRPNAEVTIIIEAGDVKDEIKALGSPKLCLSH